METPKIESYMTAAQTDYVIARHNDRIARAEYKALFEKRVAGKAGNERRNAQALLVGSREWYAVRKSGVAVTQAAFTLAEWWRGITGERIDPVNPESLERLDSVARADTTAL